MKVVVTGGCGFIGSHIVDHFISRGHRVTILDNLSSGVCNLNTKAEFVDVDLKKNLLVPHLLDADFIVHAAANANLRGNWDPEHGAFNRVKSISENIIATHALLEQMPNVPLVYLSTACIYGAAVGEKSHTGDVPRVESVYAATKLSAEHLVESYSFARKFSATTIRLVNVVGARTHQGVIADFVRMAKMGKIHAADNGSQSKNWVCVEDVVAAVGDISTDLPKSYELLTVANTAKTMSWWDIVDAMGIDRSTVSYEDREGGAIGDPINIRVESDFVCRRPIKYGIQKALQSLGWERPVK